MNLSQCVTLTELELLSAVVALRMLCQHSGIYCPHFATCLKVSWRHVKCPVGQVIPSAFISAVVGLIMLYLS